MVCFQVSILLTVCLTVKFSSLLQEEHIVCSEAFCRAEIGADRIDQILSL
ncbi:hypothetical protein M758_4G004000 [Ceratodon purpureus]|uniref:Uncharacterized protein n=1 Tax=Ceratodon purpureus TaxID=3225 RepID=A0A8T0I5E9_CERPU|nr:hypothetical protein KC19_4G004300 [Ceratodon purpureus]KAG0617640.1 hypothetical protein M758_4G004000 [Ceratodon purpureus]